MNNSEYVTSLKNTPQNLQNYLKNKNYFYMVLVVKHLYKQNA